VLALVEEEPEHQVERIVVEQQAGSLRIAEADALEQRAGREGSCFLGFMSRSPAVEMATLEPADASSGVACRLEVGPLQQQPDQAQAALQLILGRRKIPSG